MNSKRTFTLIKLAAMILGIMTMPVMAKEIFLGPPDSGAEQQVDDWNHGTGGDAYQSFDDTDPAVGAHDFTLGNTNADRGSHADWRSQIFPLGSAAGGLKPVTFSFSYKLADKVNDKDNIRVQLRFYDKATNFLTQKEFLLGSASQDSEMTSYKRLTTEGIRAPKRAQMADVTFSANFYKGDQWSSGTARFDDFSVTTVPRSLLFKASIVAAALISMCALIFSVVAGIKSSIRKANGPRERAFVIRANIGCWVFALLFMLGTWPIPRSYKLFVALIYTVSVVSVIVFIKKKRARIRLEESKREPGVEI